MAVQITRTKDVNHASCRKSQYINQISSVLLHCDIIIALQRGHSLAPSMSLLTLVPMPVKMSTHSKCSGHTFTGDGYKQQQSHDCRSRLWLDR